ncbi:MAG: hypothetical protein WC549_05710 [Actinomycetota bacterium]
MNKEEKVSLEFSQKTELKLPKKRIAIPIFQEELIRLKSDIINYQGNIHWSWFLFSIIFTVFVSTIVPYFNLKDTIYENGFLIVTAISGGAAMISLIFACYLSIKVRSNKSEIIKVIDDFLRRSQVEEYEDEILKRMDNWFAKNININNQGVNYREIPLKNNLSYLEFSLSSISKYWRGGIKLSFPKTYSEPVPNLRTPDSFLFHTGVNEDGTVIVYIYHNKDKPPALKESINVENPKQPIYLRIAVDINKINCYINNHLLYSFECNLELLKRAYLTAWGDGKPYEVQFEDIYYNYN